MSSADQALLAFLTDLHSSELTDSNLCPTIPEDLADLFISSAFLISAVEYIKEQLWLHNKEQEKRDLETCFDGFLSPLFEDDLASIAFLKDYLISGGAKNLKKVGKRAEEIENAALGLINSCSLEDQKTCVIYALREMTKYFLEEENISISIHYPVIVPVECSLFLTAHRRYRLYAPRYIGHKSGWFKFLV